MKRYLTVLIALVVLAGGVVNAESSIRSGDRIAIVGNTFADQLRIHGYLETMLLRHDFAEPVSIRDLGWAGDLLTARDRPANFPTEESTLTEHRTDVIIACFGMGESFQGAAGVEGFKKDLSAFLTSHEGKKYNGKTEVRLVLVSPIACENLGRKTPGAERRNGELKAYSRAMSEVAELEKVPFIDLFGPMDYLLREGGGTTYTTNGIHLTSFGYWAIGQAFFEQLVGELREPWRMSIDSKALKGTATGVKLSGLKGEGQVLMFSVKEQTAPSLGPPIEKKLPPQLSAKRDTLVVTGLAAGRHELTVDGVAVITAKDDEWARGVAIDASPAHREAEIYRAAINDKNLQFTYGWKALNQVHIVGERKSSPSGRALPAEVIEFNKLAKQKDAALRVGVELKTRVWKLTPVRP